MKSPVSIATVLTATLIALLGFSPVTPANAQESDEERRIELRQQLEAAEQRANALRAELYSADAQRERARLQADGARARLDERKRGYAELLMARAGTLALMPQRARLGVTVRTRADDATDAVGAFLEEVTPDGPADEAGLEPGDIVTHWNGDSLLESTPIDEESRDSAVVAWSDSEASSAPAARLIARSRTLEPEQTVTLTYRRDGTERTAEVTARALPAGLLATPPAPPTAWTAPHPPTAPRAPRALRRGDDYLVLALGGPWGDMEVVTVTKELGEYFGTDRGLLVVEPPSEDPFGLRAGDVILSIGDREPRDLSHALRILRSYEPEETVNLTIRRKGESVTLSGELPDSAGLFGWVPETPEIFAPPPPEVPAWRSAREQ